MHLGGASRLRTARYVVETWRRPLITTRASVYSACFSCLPAAPTANLANTRRRRWFLGPMIYSRARTLGAELSLSKPNLEDVGERSVPYRVRLPISRQYGASARLL